jgi:hypothetical protein
MSTIATCTTALIILSSTQSAFAGNVEACDAQALKGQELRDGHKLLESRDEFRACASPNCPSVIRNDCAHWLEEVDRRLPSIQIVVKDGHSETPITDAVVSIDGAKVDQPLEGRIVNPGVHAFHVQRRDGSTLDRQLLVVEGMKDQRLELVFESPRSAGVTKSEATPSGFPWKPLGWISGGFGVAGVGVGTLFGLVAAGDKDRAQCVDNLCNRADLDDAREHATFSTIGFVAGGLFLATAAALLFFAPSERR